MIKERKDLKILIVDDDDKSLRLLEAKLRTMGFEQILKAGNGRECLTVARQEKPDLIFLDVMMPEMDGGEVKSELSEDERTRDIPVIFSTALVTDQEIEKKGGEIGGEIFLAKPSDSEKIERAIKMAMGTG